MKGHHLHHHTFFLFTKTAVILGMLMLTHHVRAAVVAAESLPEECYTPPLSDSECGFYTDCIEAYYPCGPSGYAIGYGYKYCEKFTDTEFEECASSAGEEWMNSTLKCLQESLVPIIESDDINDVSCLSIKLNAFDSHSVCYTGGGEAIPTAPSICFLPPSDILCILSTIDKEDLISPLGIKEDIETAMVCIEQHQSAGLVCDEDSGDQMGRRCAYWRERLREVKNQDPDQDERQRSS